MVQAPFRALVMGRIEMLQPAFGVRFDSAGNCQTANHIVSSAAPAASKAKPMPVAGLQLAASQILHWR